MPAVPWFGMDWSTLPSLWSTLAVVCPLVLVGGMVDAVAGGGGLITLPSYLIAGVPAHLAIATNQLSAAIGSTASTVRLWRNGFANARLAVPAALFGFLGSVGGARIALLVPDAIFRDVLIVLLPIVAAVVLRRKSLAAKERPMPRGRRWALVAACSLACGLYNGFYGPGSGTFTLLAFTAVAGMALGDASGDMKIWNLSANVASVVTFALHGQMWWLVGAVAGAFGMVGHYIGAGMVIRDGTRIVRPVIVGVLAMLFVRTGLELAGVIA
ncbi:Sulfite exporter TauE/SafE [Bifidobacterium sp. DSM 109958]|uniref:Probable membrane transporter protein n=1 Tax=Bifidobacterium moraviense TaxID=2675323 RepID=A0A7Y0F0H6_9BIFI|nr:TSUP family transporter [Bifidobacterium sp. DSM 109958]NMM99583.1 Sulfite exporter TauE/SafE [Bifidobacterium sp. DSM 109958]